MYAIIRAGGKQYTVKPGDILRVEKLDGELGSELKLTDVLMVGGEKSFVGTPTLDKATVTVVITNQAKGPKLIVFKKKRRQGYRRMNGHRQQYTELFIKAITNPDGKSMNAESKALVFNPEKKAEQVVKSRELAREQKLARRKAEKTEGAVVAAPKTAKKKVAKKAAGKTAKKKSPAKKKVAKKAAKKK